MHVREIPVIVFNQLVSNPQNIDIFEYSRREFPWLDKGELQTLKNNSERHKQVGEAGSLALALVSSDNATSLSVHRDIPAAIINPTYQSLGQLTAARQPLDVWAEGKGSKYAETIRLEIMQGVYSAEDLSRVKPVLQLLGRVATISQELLESDRFEMSSYFESETHLPPN